MKKVRQLKAILLLLAFLAVLLCFITAVSRLDKGRSEEDRRQLEDALRRTAAACYASEGVYPPDLDYLCSNYGIQYDESQYTVYYEMFASNLMPDITVLDNENE